MKYSTVVLALAAGVLADYAPAYPVASTTSYPAAKPPAYPVEPPAYPVDPPVYKPSSTKKYEPVVTSAKYDPYPASKKYEPATSVKYDYNKYDNATSVAYHTYTTSAYTTYCPGPTTITHGDKTYTITKATTFTITDCPCTITKPIYKTKTDKKVYYTSCDEEAKKTKPAPPAVQPPKETHPVYKNPLTVVYTVTGKKGGDQPYPTKGGDDNKNNGGKPYPTGGNTKYSTKTADGYAKGTTAVYPTKPATYTGAASANKVGSLVAVAGLVALVL